MPECQQQGTWRWQLFRHWKYQHQPGQAVMCNPSFSVKPSCSSAAAALLPLCPAVYTAPCCSFQLQNSCQALSTPEEAARGCMGVTHPPSWARYLPHFPAWVSCRMPCPLCTVLSPHPCKRSWRTAEEQGCCLPGKGHLLLGPSVCWEGSWDALGRRRLRNSPKKHSVPGLESLC